MRTTLNVLSLVLLAGLVMADERSPYQSPPQATGYHDCVTHSCHLVPETKQIKKTVYEVQEVPYCLKKLPPLWSLFHHHHCDDCDACAECQCPRYKKVLVKKEVVCGEICTSKCIVEEHVLRVPCLASGADIPVCHSSPHAPREDMSSRGAR